MEQKAFETLLNDLYDIYNPSNKKDIDGISKKYVGQELDAVYYFLTKYNYAKHPNYDSKLSEMNGIKKLIQDYASGNRTLTGEKISIEEQIKNTVVRETNEKLSTTTEQITSELQKVLKQTQEEIYNLKKQITDNVESIKSSQPKNITIKLNLLYTESELILPSEINDFSIGTRFLVKDSSGKLIALEVKNIFCDFISNDNGEIIKEITIDTI